MGPVQRGASLASAVVVMALPSLALLRSPTPPQAARYFNSASLLPAIVFLIVIVTLVLGGPA
jgi:hypothetical protein